MGRKKIPPDQKVSPAESARRYRQKNSNMYQLYEKRRCEARKLKRKGQPDVIKMKFNKRENSKKTKKVFPRKSVTLTPGGKRIRSKGSGRKNNSKRIESDERLNDEGGYGGTQSEERSEDVPGDSPSEQRPSRGRKSVEKHTEVSPSTGRRSIDSSCGGRGMEDISRKRKISFNDETDPDIESSDNELEDPVWQKKQRPSKKPKLNGEGAVKSRQSVIGEKMRKKNLVTLKNDFKEEQDKNRELTKDLKVSREDLEEETIKRQIAEAKVSVKEAQIEEMKNKRLKDDSWLKFVYKDLSADAAREFKLAVHNNRDKFEVGTMRRIRNASGINFSQAPLPKSFNQTEREKAIQTFAILNSSEIPDMKANKSEMSTNKTPNKRFAIHYLTVLHDQFNIDNPDLKCSYSQFAALWPSYVIKPRPGDFTSCHCTTCENNNLLISALIKHKILDESEDVFAAIKLSRDGNSEALEMIEDRLKDTKNGTRKEEIITYVQWETVTNEISEAKSNFAKENGKKKQARKESKKRMKSIKIKNLMEICQESFGKLKDHLDRNHIMKKTIAAKKEEVLSDVTEKSALVWIDWSEGVVLRQEREIQSAWFGAKTLSLQSGYIFRKNNSQGFGSFAEGTDHKAEAIWASLRPLLKELLDKGVDKFYFVSDSPINQYRCNKNLFFLSDWCVANRVSAVWYFTETSHGKSSADGIGGSLKTTIRELMSFHTEAPINSITDLMNLLQGNTRNKVLHFSKEDVDREKNSLPSNLKSLKGALQIHEVTVSVNGDIGAKKLPTDTTYSRVNLAPSFLSHSSNNNPSSRLRIPTVEIHPSVSEE